MPRPRASGGAPIPADQRSGCILLIDDEEVILDVMYTLLHDDEGYAVVRARSGREALAARIPEPPALILIDASLRGEDPRAIVEALRQRPGWEAAALVVCSGVPDIYEITRALRANASLPKPFELEELLALVRHYVQPLL
ncbi:MAG TPA: response regulator [Ktedonobacterales bacterium]|jgi:CheY-like chemotaxis protein|nr:response regulator [Ktedonobacterales bacterium]